MSTRVFKDLKDVMESAFCYSWMNQVGIFIPKENAFRDEVMTFDSALDDKTYNIINNVVAFINRGRYYVIPNFYGVEIILTGLKFQKDRGLRVLFSQNYEIPVPGNARWLELKRDMIETNHTNSRLAKHLPENATAIDQRFLELSYVYSTRVTENIGKYNYDSESIIFYYYDGKIYLTGNWDIIKELDDHGFVRDESLPIPVLDKQ